MMHFTLFSSNRWHIWVGFSVGNLCIGALFGQYPLYSELDLFLPFTQLCIERWNDDEWIVEEEEDEDWMPDEEEDLCPECGYHFYDGHCNICGDPHEIHLPDEDR